MAGVNRPYTLVDVLGTLNQQGQQQADVLNGFGDFVETDEQATLSDLAVVTHSAPPTYDAGTWGTFTWT